MKFYIIAGEASGDLHGGNLIRGLREKDSEAEFRFWGGDCMQEAAGERGTLIHHYREGAVMGLTDVLKKAGTLLGNVKACKKDIAAWKPDAVVLIDYPGFNMKIAEFCHNNGIRVFYYIAPKTWASREGRNRKLRAWVDKLFIVFPFEMPYFTEKKIPFIYKGNPLLDSVDSSPALSLSREEFLSSHGLEDKPHIAILAGSRKGEISRMMPVCMDVVRKMNALPEYAGWQFIIAGAPSRSLEDYSVWMEGIGNVSVVFGDTYGVLKHAGAAIINSGTASLEAALIGTPQVVCWSTSAVTAFVARKILHVLDNVKYISLGNLCIDRLAFRELIQEDFTSDEVLSEVRRLVEDEGYRSRMISDYAEIRASLGGRGASLQVAEAMIGEIKANV